MKQIVYLVLFLCCSATVFGKSSKKQREDYIQVLKESIDIYWNEFHELDECCFNELDKLGVIYYPLPSSTNSNNVPYKIVLMGFGGNGKEGVHYGTINGKKWYLCYDDKSSLDCKGAIVDGKLVVPCEFCSVLFEDGLLNGPFFKASKKKDNYMLSNGYEYLFDWKGDRIPIPRPFNSCKSINIGNNSLIKVSGVVNDISASEVYDYDGNLIVSAFTAISEQVLDNKQYYKVSMANNKMGLIDENLNWIFSPMQGFKEIKFDSNSSPYIIASKENQTTIYDLRDGNSNVIPYSSIKFDGDNPIVKVVKDGSFGLYDIQNKKELVGPDFEDIELFNGTNLVKYRLNGFWGVLDLNGKEIIPTTRGYTTINYYKRLKKFTYYMNGFKGECDYTGKELSKIALPVKNNSSVNSSTTSHSHNHSSPSASTAPVTPSQNQGNQVREYTETVPVQVWQPCGACNGYGQCQVCYGQGWTYSNSSYNGKKECSACHWTGKCTLCGGRGGQNVVRYEQRTVYR